MTFEGHRSAAEALAGKEFPCPVCGDGLQIRITRNQKPYCVCNSCGIQLFVRGKEGIRRLLSIIESKTLIASEGSQVIFGVTLYNRIQQLRAQKKELEGKQGLIFRDPDLDNTIRAVDNEIARVQGELNKLAHKRRSEKKA